jgi:hypothetical protein
VKAAIAWALIFTGFLWWMASARAQQMPMSYTLTLSPDDAALVIRGMQLLPYGEVARAISGVSQQVKDQQDQAAKAKPEAPK